MSRSRRGGNSTVGATVLIVAACIALPAFSGLGSAWAGAIHGQVSAASKSACELGRGELDVGRTGSVDDSNWGDLSGVADGARSQSRLRVGGTQHAGVGSIVRHAPEVVRAIRDAAHAIPEGQTRQLVFDGHAYDLGHVPDLPELQSFIDARMPFFAESSRSVATAQASNLAHLLDRAFDETLARGNIPGPGGRFSAKKVGESFTAADVPFGVYAYNGHASSFSITASKQLDALELARNTPFEIAIRTQLEHIGFRGEPVILDACSVAKCMSDPRAAARRVANGVGAPVIAPTRNVFLTLPMDGRPFRGRLIGNSTANESGFTLPVASGDWVLVMPDAWGGDVIRGPHNIAD